MRSDRPEDLLAGRGGALELLRLPALLMRGLVGLRNGFYDRGWMRSARLDLPVVSVGNLTVGGTGKTPMVVWLVRALEMRGFRVGVLARGYRSGTEKLNDEGRLLEDLLPDALQVQRADRVTGGRDLARKGAGVIVLDDGFQHRRLARDVDLVLVDVTRPWGLPPGPDGGPPVQSHLPRGLMREGVASLARASAIVLTRSDSISPDSLEELERELEDTVPGIPRLLAVHRPVGLRTVAEDLEEDAGSPASLVGREVQLVSGIGNPRAFEDTARSAGATILGVHTFPDHHEYSIAELDTVRAGGGDLLVTAKDSVKLRRLRVPHLVLEVELEFERGEQVMAALLDSLQSGVRDLEVRAMHEALHG